MTEKAKKITIVAGEKLAWKPLSQSRLIWLRFRQHKLGMASGIFLLSLGLLLLFAEFVSPYAYNKPQEFSYGSMQIPYGDVPLTRIHFFSQEGFSLRPFVYGLKFVPGNIRRGIREHYEEDQSQKYFIRLFVRGDEYALWGLFKTNVHLFGVEAPGKLFLFGTDTLGQDIFSRVLMGGRITLAIGLIVVLMSLIVGIPLGGFSGYYGGKTDTLIQKLIEVVMALPRLMLLLALSAVLAAYNVKPMGRFWGIALLLALVSWAPLARVIRGQFLALREEDFITAAKAVGASDLRVVLRHILPNTMSYLVVTATLTIPNVIIIESTLSFLGYGIRYPLVSWGMLLEAAQVQLIHVLTFSPWYLIPGFFIIITVLAFNFLGDALRDAVDPFTAVAKGE